MGTLKPGWYLLAFLALYCLIATVAWQRSERTLQAFRSSLSADALSVATTTSSLAPASLRVAEGRDIGSALGSSAVPGELLWFPIPGASLPENRLYLPGAPLPTGRRGVRQGFEFYADNAGVPIVYGTAVVAAADAVVTRVDTNYKELSEGAWQSLELELAKREATQEERNALRGRQVWLRLDDGRVLRYAHLSATAPELAQGERVYRGEVIGYVGNSGTYDGVMNTTRGPRLGFEIWQGKQFFGQNLVPAAAVEAASSLFAP